MSFLHVHAEDVLGAMLHDVLLHSVIDTLKLLPFLFLTYLLMEYIEHRAGDRAERFMKRAGHFAPVVGGLLGLVPQCGFSAAGAGLYAGRVISVGTLIAIFLSTSDEMLPILISGNMPAGEIALILVYKALVAILVGFGADFVVRALHKGESINIDAICDEDGCHCERGIFYSAIHHTLTVSIFVLIITVTINVLVFFVGEENLALFMYDKPVVSHIIAAVFGLIPNCAASVALATFFGEGLITAGTMMAGLFSGAGVGVLVLFKVNKHIKTNLFILLTLVCIGLLFGLVFDLLFPMMNIV